MSLLYLCISIVRLWTIFIRSLMNVVSARCIWLPSVWNQKSLCSIQLLFVSKNLCCNKTIFPRHQTKVDITSSEMNPWAFFYDCYAFHFWVNLDELLPYILDRDLKMSNCLHSCFPSGLGLKVGNFNYSLHLLMTGF